MQKHDEEVRFLETAAGLELTILQTQNELNLQSQSYCPALPRATLAPPIMPQAPTNPPQKPEQQKPGRLYFPHNSKALCDGTFRFYPNISFIDNHFNGSFGFRVRYPTPEVHKLSTLDEMIVEDTICILDLADLFSAPRGYSAEDYYIENAPLEHLSDSLFSKLMGQARCKPDKIHQEQHNQWVTERFERINREAAERYAQQCRDYDRAVQEYEQAMHEYQIAQSAYELQAHEQDTKQAAFQQEWLAVRDANVQTLTTGLKQAQEQLETLYSSTRILPKPYQYPEAVFYLYDFLSTSSDDYDIKYALARVDANEMKRLMAAVIQNQAKQAQMLAAVTGNIARELRALGESMDSLADTASQQLSVAEASLRDSQNFLFQNADVYGKLKPLPIVMHD
ncbi:MAG: hypothetical protein LBN05_05815 [Oscillospiraceae bacterium]|nr:hypothetical protein [Oscillospiraceae bacterium]